MSPWLLESVDLSLCLLFGSVSTTLGLRLCLCDCDCICLCLCLYVWIGCGSISCSSSVSVSPRQRSSTLPAYPFVCFLLIFYILPVPLSFFPCLYPPQTPQNRSTSSAIYYHRSSLHLTLIRLSNKTANLVGYLQTRQYIHY